MTHTQTALITGASRGLGKTLAQFLAAQGTDLILTARGSEALAAAAHELSHYGGRTIALAGDVADANHRRALAQAAEELGGLDLLVNNASILGPSPLPPLAEYPLESLEQVLEVNFLAPLGLLQVTLPLLQHRRGLVVNISSDAAVGGYPGWGGYGAATSTTIALAFETVLLFAIVRRRTPGRRPRHLLPCRLRAEDRGRRELDPAR